MRRYQTNGCYPRANASATARRNQSVSFTTHCARAIRFGKCVPRSARLVIVSHLEADETIRRGVTYSRAFERQVGAADDTLSWRSRMLRRQADGAESRHSLAADGYALERRDGNSSAAPTTSVYFGKRVRPRQEGSTLASNKRALRLRIGPRPTMRANQGLTTRGYRTRGARLIYWRIAAKDRALNRR